MSKITLSSKEIIVKYNMTNDAEQAVKRYLQSQITARQLGMRLDRSHQGAINLVGSLVRQWVGDGKLVFADDIDNTSLTQDLKAPKLHSLDNMGVMLTSDLQLWIIEVTHALNGTRGIIEPKEDRSAAGLDAQPDLPEETK